MSQGLFLFCQYLLLSLTQSAGLLFLFLLHLALVHAGKIHGLHEKRHEAWLTICLV